MKYTKINLYLPNKHKIKKVSQIKGFFYQKIVPC